MVFSKNHSFLFMLFPILFILVTMQFASAGLLPFSSKHVVIISKLVTRPTLIVHCTNKEEDKGVISLGPGDSFDFRFPTFDIFRADRDDNPRSKVRVCSECIWSIYELAPCRDRRDGGQPNCFQWAS
ncbi:hypothetical protein BRARA_I01495 [Brassica rapa]|uniref:Uncharacterized protein n=1 Tax=Brassica campestris TaxID=3711 RepID=A0A397XTY2_BRACM|nr:hypothetical protein BRARA_I01495 [Brassica rapa]